MNLRHSSAIFYDIHLTASVSTTEEMLTIAAPSDATVICFDNSLTIMSDKTFFVVVLFTNPDSEIWILAPMDFMVDSRNDDVGGQLKAVSSPSRSSC